MQFVKQGFRVLQIERVEALGEPAVDRSEKITGLFPLALIAPLKASGVFLLRSTPALRCRRRCCRLLWGLWRLRKPGQTSERYGTAIHAPVQFSLFRFGVRRLAPAVFAAL